LQEAGYEVLLSIGELTENDIGSNCGQHITNFLRAGTSIPDAYTVPLTSVRDREAAAIC
ncbi:MAG: radical SAM protein, partial [Calditrichaeota bacterium]|nr:radical SAM protein [Calditrichota bacterium]